MIVGVTQVALLVHDYEEAKAFYCHKLEFTDVEDTDLDGGKRWVRLRAPGGQGAEILLSKAVGADQAAFVGRQAGGRVLFFLHCTDLESDFARFQAAGVHFTEAPRNETYGKVAVFEDLYGNRIDLIEPRSGVLAF